MFSTKEFIEASRSFVCLRIETYENKETEELIRFILNGKYANTAFCIFDPQGRQSLSGTGRSPSQVMGRGASDSNAAIIKEMRRVASNYRQKGDDKEVVLQDFLSFGQALNVASADQRLLVFVDADKSEKKKLSPALQELFADEEIVGRFHLDFAGDEDGKWHTAVEGAKSRPAINIIRSNTFGLDGKIMSRLPLDASLEELKSTLMADNKKFGASEERKVYANHVMEGKRQGIKYETEIPYGEDRDGDGAIDGRGGRGGGGARGRGGRPGGGRGRVERRRGQRRQ